MRIGVLFICLAMISGAAYCQHKPWHGIQRQVHYQPSGEDFICVNGKQRFNRALYGSNTAFRVEAGDLPEFAIYLPGMGGNLQFALLVDDSSGKKSKSLIKAETIEARYHAGSMIYKIGDPVLGKGYILMTVLALYDQEGMLVKMETSNIPSSAKILAVYGGATGLKFSRDGDVGADPESSFYLKPEYCRDNIYRIKENSFELLFGTRKPLSEEERYDIQRSAQGTTDTVKNNKDLKLITGIFPGGSILKISDASMLSSPGEFYLSGSQNAPVICSKLSINAAPLYFLISRETINGLTYDALPSLFKTTEARRKELSGRVKVITPDPYINTLGGALSMAADAIWEDPSYMHGAVAWRMRLNGWRGAYIADVLGWHDRAEKHFSSYALSQLTSPASAPVVADTALHLARSQEKLGNSLFSSGYISRNPNGDFRPHHYDMNLVFIDQLLNHFYWTGDTAYVKKLWPLLVRHLDWEKRNFDADGDGLYDAYASIWASDALQYSGGGVTHSSAYNYKANKLAADLAVLIDKDPWPYLKEAEKILKAMNEKLWMNEKGVYAEFKDLLGNHLVHPEPALWTIYHAIDSKVPGPFQSWQLLQYVDSHIPHIPVMAQGLKDTGLYTLSTSNWQPYTWSLNNVALGELMHTALAYWQGGRSEEAFRLWKSTLVESMYLGASPGNFQQLSFYDAIRGELYRDFADGIGMTGRSLVEGLFGIFPDALHDTLHINPGFPASWDHAKLSTPDIDFSFKRNSNRDEYHIIQKLSTPLALSLKIKARKDQVLQLTVNGKNQKWADDSNAIEIPVLLLKTEKGREWMINIEWKGKSFQPAKPREVIKGEAFQFTAPGEITSVFDPQLVLGNMQFNGTTLKAISYKEGGNKVFFIKTMQGAFSYWMPVRVNVLPEIEMAIDDQWENLTVKNNTSKEITGQVSMNMHTTFPLTIAANKIYRYSLKELNSFPGTNKFCFYMQGDTVVKCFQNWSLKAKGLDFDKIDLAPYFNDNVNNIFRHEYLSPRPASSTLQLPAQGIGNWAYPLVTANINDSGLRAKAGPSNQIIIQQGIPFATPSSTGRNIIFTSLWDNFPDSVVIPLTGKASHSYFLMAGSTDPMQSRMKNGEIKIIYTNGTYDIFDLKNPENWWPIEQDYYEDGYAFTTGAPSPVRVYLKSGADSRSYNNYSAIRGFSNRAIDGGAATVLDLPLDPSKEIRSLVLKSVANDVVIGLMSLTLVRNK